MKEAKVTIDPFKQANDQVDEIVKKLVTKLPLKFAVVKIEVTISPEFSNRSYGVLKQYGLKSEKWLDDGSLFVTARVPRGAAERVLRQDKQRNQGHGRGQGSQRMILMCFLCPG